MTSRERTAQAQAPVDWRDYCTRGALADRLDRWSRACWIPFALFWVGLALRLWMVHQTTVICRDGLHYIEFAKQVNAGRGMELSEWALFNPYPVMIALVARLGVSYAVAGQLIAAICGALAIIPLYLWCRQAFNRHVADLAAFLYALHPQLIRMSADVLREGMYWFLGLWAVACLWSAKERDSWWRYAAGGLLASLCALTRIEGCLVFFLLGLWCLGDVIAVPRRWLHRFGGAALVACMFPLTIALMNIVFSPNSEWSMPRPVQVAQDVVAAVSVPASEEGEDSELFRQLDSAGGVPFGQFAKGEAVRQLAWELPVWNTDGTHVPHMHNLRKLLLLLNDHRWAVYLSDYFRCFWVAFQIPVVIFFAVGIRYCWRSAVPARDIPLVLYGALFSAICFVHLTTAYVLEARYLFTLTPLIFPWTAFGMIHGYFATGRWLAERRRIHWFYPLATTVCCLMMCLTLGKMIHGFSARKVTQRVLGEQLQADYGPKLRMAGPPGLRRVAFYANSQYLIAPKLAPSDLAVWLQQQKVEFLVQPAMRAPSGPPGASRILDKDPRFLELQVYRVSAAQRG